MNHCAIQELQPQGSLETSALPLPSVYYDDVDGTELDPAEVFKGEQREFGDFAHFDVFDPIKRQEAKARGSG